MNPIMEEHIPAINADGCTCGDSDHFVSFHTVREPEGRLLDEYQMLINNSAIDKKGRNQLLFPDWK